LEFFEGLDSPRSSTPLPPIPTNCEPVSNSEQTESGEPNEAEKSPRALANPLAESPFPNAHQSELTQSCPSVAQSSDYSSEGESEKAAKSPVAAPKPSFMTKKRT
jgi:hypothetical protein